MPPQYKAFIESWKKYCPEYQIVQWDEENFDIDSNQYCKQAYDAKQWAFVSDYARLKIIYENGGIYLDTDVELVKSMDNLLGNKAFIGFQNDYEVNTGLGFGAEKHNEAIKSMLSMYNSRRFIGKNGEYNRIPCPATNTVALIPYGLKIGPINSMTIQLLKDIAIYPEEYFNPMNRNNGKINVTDNTYTIHHYAGSWSSGKSKKLSKIKKVMPDWFLRAHDNKIAKKDIKAIKNEFR